MKKFDLRKWMKEQKALPKGKRTLDSKPPIRNKKKLTEDRKLLVEQTTQNAQDHYDIEGFSKQGNHAKGYLYI